MNGLRVHGWLGGSVRGALSCASRMPQPHPPAGPPASPPAALPPASPLAALPPASPPAAVPPPSDVRRCSTPRPPSPPAPGRVFLVGTQLDGRHTLRLAIGAADVQPRHIHAAWAVLREALDGLPAAGTA